MYEGEKYTQGSLYAEKYSILLQPLRGQRSTGKIQSNNYHHGSCGPSLRGKTSSVSLILR